MILDLLAETFDNSLTWATCIGISIAAGIELLVRFAEPRCGGPEIIFKHPIDTRSKLDLLRFLVLLRTLGQGLILSYPQEPFYDLANWECCHE